MEKKLLKQFKTVKAIREASVEELQQAPGMNRPAAEAVYHFFEAQRDLTRYHADEEDRGTRKETDI